MDEGKKVIVPIPFAVGICRECAEKSIYKKDDELITYCDHSKTGGIFVQGIWMLYTPVSREVFAELIVPRTEKRKSFGIC